AKAYNNFDVDARGGMNPFGGELAFIEWLRRQTPPDSRVLIGPGDDAAVLRLSSANALLTTDMLLEGSCFKLAEAGPYRVGRKPMGVNLSDVAAMAAKPAAAFVSLGLPRAGGSEIAEGLYRGMRSLADEFDISIAGGDTNSWDGPLVISVAIIGEP